MHTKTISQLSALLQSKQVSATELAKHYLNRIAASDLNAFLHDFFIINPQSLQNGHDQLPVSAGSSSWCGHQC